ncbi:hypothetical protein ACFV0R_04220 [Streptomyces sp. NPDC059578]|uniref:hypothetical protein n=1 Tax=Streptomyces sp. NPDC059578 TaxID=3346874 RepID=UPI00367C6A38
MSAVDTRSRPAAGPPAGRRAPRHVHPLRVESLRGIAPWTGLTVASATGLALLLTSSSWQGSWWETQVVLRHAAAIFAAPLAGAAGCFQGAREHRRRTVELRAGAARGPLPQLALAALPGALWAAVGYLVAALGCLLATLPYAGDGAPQLGPALTDAVFLVSVSVLGHVCGALLPHRLAPPLFGVLVLFVSSVPSGARHLAPLGGSQLPADSVAVGWQPWVVTVCWGGLVLTAVLARGARRRYLALVPLVAVVVAAVPLVRTGDRVWQPDPLSRQAVCATATVPRICTNRLYAQVLPEVEEALAPLDGRLRGVAGVPRLWDVRGGGRSADAVLPRLESGNTVVRGRLSDPEGYLTTVTYELTGDPASCRAGRQDRLATAGSTVALWLLPNPARARETERQRGWSAGAPEELAALDAREAAVTRLDAMAPADRRTWLAGYFAARAACAPGRVPPL